MAYETGQEVVEICWFTAYEGAELPFKDSHVR